MFLITGEDTYLKDCLLSLAEQTVTNFEVILVASGTDIPEDIISSFGDRINIKAYQTDKTIVAAVRNEGMEYASGDYIMFLDCDDYLAVDFIEKLYNMVTSEGLDFSFGKLENTWYRGAFIWTRIQKRYRKKRTRMKAAARMMLTGSLILKSILVMMQSR